MKQQIYLAGQMTGLSKAEYSTWRRNFKQQIESCSDHFTCFDPGEEYDLIPDDSNLPIHLKDQYNKAAMLLDLDKLRNSRIVVCNMNHQNSMGTSAELALAWEWHIPIIGFCLQENSVTVHPWWKQFATVMFKTPDDVIDYILKNY
jgi:hypothetical protein